MSEGKVILAMPVRKVFSLDVIPKTNAFLHTLDGLK